jgi:hypothetical protein
VYPLTAHYPLIGTCCMWEILTIKIFIPAFKHLYSDQLHLITLFWNLMARANVKKRYNYIISRAWKNRKTITVWNADFFIKFKINFEHNILLLNVIWMAFCLKRYLLSYPIVADKYTEQEFCTIILHYQYCRRTYKEKKTD